jgi:hypothetical protein
VVGYPWIDRFTDFFYSDGLYSHAFIPVSIFSTKIDFFLGVDGLKCQFTAIVAAN